ncbi:MAG: hypothetical protein FJY67_09760 [Calditrichaeota bacterium]|nr:hypothetical protein [Calditrichota bacterium]
MRRTVSGSLIVILLFSLTLFPHHLDAASRTSLTLTGGGGPAIGWWGERWSPFTSGEVNLRYEFRRGTGILMLAGLSKTYLADLSNETIASESRIRDIRPEHQPYTTIINASQDGNFKQVPLGFGFYQEGLIGGLRAYGSGAFVVHLWKFERNQALTERVTPPQSDTLTYNDNWNDKQDGANAGLQLAGGVLYPIRRDLFIDASVAFHILAIDEKYAGIAYYGYPARSWTSERRSARGVEKGASFLILRAGVRWGS